LINYWIEDCIVYLYRHTTKMDEILGRLLAEINAIQDKMDDGQEEMKARAGFLASQIDVNQKEMKTMLDACLEKLVANPGELKSVAVHEEVPKEEVAVETFGALKKRHEDRHPAVGRSRRNRPRAMVGPGRNWPPPAEG
jgi:hypothetical protein